jgi:hypothetical protein
MNTLKSPKFLMVAMAAFAGAIYGVVAMVYQHGFETSLYEVVVCAVGGSAVAGAVGSALCRAADILGYFPRPEDESNNHALYYRGVQVFSLPMTNVDANDTESMQPMPRYNRSRHRNGWSEFQTG